MKIPALLLCAALANASCSAPQASAHTPAHTERQSAIKVIPLRYAVADEVAVSLRGVLKDVRIVPDARTNSLVIAYEREADLAQLERCVEQLDVEVKASK